MRVAFGVLTVLLTLPAAAPANPPANPDVRYVAFPVAEVRCQPSTNPQMYVTNQLHKGDAVEVVEELPDGWLKINPPPGSFSWVDMIFIKEVSSNHPNYAVNPAPDQLVEVYIGSEVLKGRPTVAGAKLKRGTQVRAIGQPLADDNQTTPRKWLPIEPPKDEFRYIKADVVNKNKPAVDTVAAARVPTNSAPAGSTFSPAAGSASAAAVSGAAIAPVPDLQALYARARQAQQANNLPEAITLYDQAARTAQNQGQAQWANQVFAHAQALRDRLQGAPASQTRAARPAQGDPTVRLSPPQGTTPDYTAPAAAATLTARGSPAGSLPSSGPGRLRHAGRAVEHQRTYVLEDAQGLPLLYVTPDQGIDLEPYVNHNVELFGQTAYRGDIRAYYMTVARVQPLP